MDPLGSLIAWAADYGIAGLLGVAVFERLVPMLPSYGFLVAVGIGAAEGGWSVPAAFLVTTAGSLAGCFAYYALAAAIGEARSIAFFTRFARLFGVSPARVARLIAYFRDNQRALVFGAQLVPTVRLIAPGIAGLLGTDVRLFAIASAAGIALWNGLFIGVGYLASFATAAANASMLALQILAVLLLCEGLAALAWHGLRRRRGRLAPIPASAISGKE
ncbi:membrane-associated protein [Roseomonas hellenica]|uniref:Membrane-associated protein n=1 Tax=Plastoroseomonas hellenica TaxID=2687306 RepID=A0ABS5F1T8_9PROT|nr:VTT domain-containing protein [Plastoroseomonas hellenica]MBR0666529.1 membrane-associated protein [Plastoroseomonas hellenica]